MAGVNDMLAKCRSLLGKGEPNVVHSWYGARNGSYYRSGSTPWCDMFITWGAYQSGNYKAVCPKGDRAYTVYHAQDFQRLGRWHSGTSDNVRKAKPGDIVFFDWGGGNSIGAIDHVGIVEKNLGGGRLQCIEGNTSNRCLRRVRDSSTIAGYGRPAYVGGPATEKPVPEGAAPSTDLAKGDEGEQVKALQRALNKLGAKPALEVDGEFGPATEKALKAFQKKAKIDVDGEYGPQSRAALAKALGTKPVPPAKLPPVDTNTESR